MTRNKTCYTRLQMFTQRANYKLASWQVCPARRSMNESTSYERRTAASVIYIQEGISISNKDCGTDTTFEQACQYTM
jgi:hypothetical protein